MQGNTEVPEEGQGGSTNTAQEHLALQQEEHKKIKRMMNYTRIGDDLDSAVLQVVENILKDGPSVELHDFSMNDVQDIIHSLPPVETILGPEFFLRVTLPFRLLRRCLDMHLVNPIKDTMISAVPMPEEDREDVRLFEHVWFLLFVCASPQAVGDAYKKFTDSNSKPTKPRSPTRSINVGAPVRNEAMNIASNVQDARSVKVDGQNSAYAPQPHRASAHNTINNPPMHVNNNYFTPRYLKEDQSARINPIPLDQPAYETQQYSNSRSNNIQDPSYAQSKKGYAVEAYFRDRKFKGAPEQSINNLIRDFEICAAQQCLDLSQKSLFFVNALADPAREYFLAHCSPTMPFDQIATQMRRHYNSETRKLQLQSEMDSLDLGGFMRKNQITDYSVGLTKLSDHINALAPQLPVGFGDDAHKTRYLRRAVMRHDWAQQTISQLTTARYSYLQFITALQESLQLKEEMSRAEAPDVNYGQYVNNPRDVRYPNNPAFRGNNRWDNRRSQSPYSNYNRSHNGANNVYQGRSRSPYQARRQFDRGADSRHRRNPNLPPKRFCFGCGSPDHILRDRKCTPTLESIKTNIVEQCSNDTESAAILAEQFLTLHSRQVEQEDQVDSETPMRNVDETNHVHFQESIYELHEDETLTAHMEAEFAAGGTRINFLSIQDNSTCIDEYSNIHFTVEDRKGGYPGFCVDIGAPKSVIGKRQLDELLKFCNKSHIPRINSNKKYRFGDVTVPSLGMIEVSLSVPPPRRNISVLMDIVPVDIPPLLGLDVLDSEQLYACNVTNRLVQRQVLSDSKAPLRYKDVWSVPLTRYNNHLYAKMSFPEQMFYTTTQLQRFHRQFAHPSATKLYNLLKKAGLEAVDSKTLEKLEEIVARCEPCQRIRNAPLRFRVAMGHDNVRFNSRVYIDIMYLDGRPVLHIVDEATRFSSARFLTKVSTDSVWDAIVMCWSSVYTGLPHYMMVDEGSQFRKVFAELSALHDVKLEKSGVQSHNSLGVGERYHKPLRDTYRKLKLDHPSMQRQLLLALAVKAMNDTLGPEGFVPSSLVFGEFPSLRTFAGPQVPRPSLAERALAAQEARRYMAKHLAQVRVKGALNFHTPPATDRTYQPGDKVLIWREKLVENRIGEWVGPYTVSSFEENSRIVLVQKDPDSPHERYHMTQVKPFLEPEENATNFMKTVHSTLSKFSSSHIHVTEIISKDDPRAYAPEMQEAIRSEVKDLLKRGTFKVMLKEELPNGANALTARFVLAIKSNADGEIKYKARYVMGGHRDILKNYLVHGAHTLQASSARLILALASIYDFDVWSSDVKLAYLQSTEPLLRRVFIKNPAQEFELEPHECFELLRPLYGLCDAGDLWHQTLHKHLIEDLKLIATKTDKSLYFQFRNGELCGINGTYVDDLLRAGDGEFKKLCSSTHRRFETSGDQSLPFLFAGFHLKRTQDCPFEIDQTFYLKKIEELDIDLSNNFSDFRSMRMKLAWLANTRPDLQFEISQLAQVTEERYDLDAKAHLKKLNSAIRYAHNNVTSLKIPKLDKDSLRIVGYSDAAFANNYDLTSQLGRIILLQDDTNNAIPVSFKSYKSRRVTRSILSAEVIAFADLFDDAFSLRSQLEQATNRAAPMHLLTDSKSLFDIISKGSRTSEKRIMLDIHAAREAYQNREISNIGFVRSSQNIADGLTKPKMQDSLLQLIRTGRHVVNCEQWILRNPKQRDGKDN